MSRDLTIVPYLPRIPDCSKWVLAYERLPFQRNRALWDTIEHMPSAPLPEDFRFTWYDDKGIKDVRVDAMGNPLCYVLARSFRKVEPEALEMGEWNTAVLAFIKALPKDAQIYLWWH